ncbi:MAG: putative secreted protein [Nocardioides sp.]|nr:putative secreted protein [Nocardioides sp.]
MQKSIKGALAAGVGGVLLLGGAGTLAYWTGSTDVIGGAIDSGSLSLTQGTGQICSDWTLDSAGGSTTYTPGSTLVVPGDLITKTCDYTVNATGAHLSATVGLEAPAISGGNALASALTPSATYTLAGATIADGETIDDTADGQELTALVTVTFESATSGTTGQDMAAALGDLTVSLTQTHS